MGILTTSALIFLCLLLEGFFSGSELGIVSADPMQLRHKAAKGSKGARMALKMVERPEWLLSTTLVGTNIAVVTNTTLATALVIQLFGEQSSWVAIVLAAPLIWIFGEIVPKSVFQQKADILAPVAIFPLRLASYLFAPVLYVFSNLTRWLSHAVGEEPRSPFSLREELFAMVQMSPAGGDIEPMERSMIRRLFSFSETMAWEIMTPWVDVVAVEQKAKSGDVARLAAAKAHQRLPVFSGRSDNVTGVLDTLELLGLAPEDPIRPLVLPLHYVPETKSIRDLLLELRQANLEMAVVVDEFGGPVGIITLEDIVEEVVEEIEDEFDAAQPDDQPVRQLGERHFLVSARLELDEVQELLNLELPRGDYSTLAGFLLEKTRAIPREGDVVLYRDIRFTIQRAAPQAIQQVRIRW